MKNQEENNEEITITKGVIEHIKEIVIQKEREKILEKIRKKDYRIKELEDRIELLTRIVRDGKVIINWYSTDCDGAIAQGSVEFKTLDEYDKWLETQTEWVEGPFSFEMGEEAIESRTYGAGWGIN